MVECPGRHRMQPPVARHPQTGPRDELVARLAHGADERTEATLAFRSLPGYRGRLVGHAFITSAVRRATSMFGARETVIDRFFSKQGQVNTRPAAGRGAG